MRPEPADGIWLFREPDKRPEFHVLKLSPGTVLCALSGASGGWYRVRTLGTDGASREGWVSGRFTRELAGE